LNFNVFNSIILAGIIQGIIFGLIVLWSKKYRHKSVYFLVTLIIVYSLSNFQYYLQDIGFFSYEELFRTIYMPWADLTPALLYFYVVFYLYPKHSITLKEYLLFFPFVFTTLLSVLYKIFSRIDDRSEFLTEIAAFVRNYIAYYTEMISALVALIVIFTLFKRIKIYKEKHSDFEINHIKLQLEWLIKTLRIYVFLVVLWISTVLIDLYVEELSFYPVWLGVAFLIYWLGHIGIYKYGVIEERKHIRKKIKSKLNDKFESKTKHIIIERLKHFLEAEKRFLNPDLSRISFKDYINTLRVEEAKSYLVDDDFSAYTLVAIGLEAGFNSKSAFNTSFKKITGETPSQFKKRHAN